MNKFSVGDNIWFVYQCGSTISVQSGKVTKVGELQNKSGPWPYVVLDNKLTIGERGIYKKQSQAIDELERRLNKKHKIENGWR
jgi:hypothetical protein